MYNPLCNFIVIDFYAIGILKVNINKCTYQSLYTNIVISLSLHNQYIHLNNSVQDNIHAVYGHCLALDISIIRTLQYGTMILVMEDLSSYMRHRPRFWLNLLTVLEATFIGETPSPILLVQCYQQCSCILITFMQRCKSSLCGIWGVLDKFLQ